MRKWLIGLGLVLAIVLVLCFLIVFDVYNQGDSTDDVAVATFDDVSVIPSDCPLSKVELRNKRDIPLDLGGWKIVYDARYFNSIKIGEDFYRIPAKTIVAPGDKILVWHGVGKDDAHNLHMGDNGSHLTFVSVGAPGDAGALQGEGQIP